MKKCIPSAAAGALAMLAAIILITSPIGEDGAKEYVHTEYVSSIPQEECFSCGEGILVHYAPERYQANA